MIDDGSLDLFIYSFIPFLKAEHYNFNKNKTVSVKEKPCQDSVVVKNWKKMQRAKIYKICTWRKSENIWQLYASSFFFLHKKTTNSCDLNNPKL